MTGPELAALLIARNRSQTEFAGILGRSIRQVNRWCRAPDPIPQYAELAAQRLAKRVVIPAQVRMEAADGPESL